MRHLLNGATWLRADFHLHTNADKEFRHDKNEKPGIFASKYVERLLAEGMGIGVITNHNKLDYEKFKAIRKCARKEEIFLLPGVELSVNDGARGIHCLIVFDDHWFQNGYNFAETFLDVAFENIPNRENENTRCKFNFSKLLEKLKENQQEGRDSFLVLAHVEDKSGFLNELEGGRIEQLAGMPLFKEFVLGMQKFRTADNMPKIRGWFGSVGCPVPAFVEGSDCKSLGDVGKAHQQNGQEKRTYIKLGDYSFEAVKFALRNHSIRVSRDHTPNSAHAHLRTIEFTGGKLDGQTVHFNADLNCLIGTPGAGKSSILETVRYILDLEIGDNAANKPYKEKVVSHLLGSGGKGVATVTDRNGRLYTIERTLGEEPVIRNDQGERLNIAINQGIISGLYFGQKDLSNITDNFNQSFLEKFIGDALKEVRAPISKQEEKVRGLIEQLEALQKVREEAEDLKQEKDRLAEQIRLFDEYDIKERLGRQERFEADLDQMERVEEESVRELEVFREAAKQFSETLEKLQGYESQENNSTFQKAHKQLEQIQHYLKEVEQRTGQLEKQELAEIKQLRSGLQSRYNEEREAFAEVRRTINADGNLKADDYLRYQRELKTTTQKLKSIEEQLRQEVQLREQLAEEMEELRALHEKEAGEYAREIEAINEEKAGVSIKFLPHGNKEAFAEDLADFFKGTNIRTHHYQSVAEAYHDMVAIYHDLHKSDSKLAEILSGGRHLLNFQTRFEEMKAELLTYQPPHLVELLYQGRPIQQYSVGERASALILFTLSMGDHDLIVIDQPEDDLNSQAIYKEVVSTLLKNKHKTQFLFATHNPNIPVLGDCEQILCCKYFGEELSYEAGSIDHKNNQKNIIQIMEGGPEAFQKRTEIYSRWAT